jgi:hypothetical protein
VRLLDPTEALRELRQSGIVADAQVSGLLDLRQLIGAQDACAFGVTFSGCILESVQAVSVAFLRPVAFDRCQVACVRMSASFFRAGLEITKCSFTSTVAFDSGGHNELGASFRIGESTFGGFVNFFDCWFGGPVEVRACTFSRGTNLLGCGNLIDFGVPPVSEANIGTMDIEGEDAA